MQQAHWANEIAVEEHVHVVIKLASGSDSSSDTDTVFGMRADAQADLRLCCSHIA